MTRNIVVYSDGTGQDGGVRPDQRLSNVYKMYRASRVGPDSIVDPADQVAFYDPGLGTDDDVHGFGRAWRAVGKFLASVAGRGIGTNIADCYEFILNHWEPGDRIYIVGFSRGAYTARCVAQLLSLCGVATREAGRPEEPLRRFARSTRLVAERAVHQVYEHGAGHPPEAFEEERQEQARRFRRDHGSDVDGLSNADPYFVGVFDTVAALGAKGLKYAGLVSSFVIGGVALCAVAAAIVHWISGSSFVIWWLALAASAAAGVCFVSWRGSRRFIDDFPAPGAPRRRHRVRWRAENYDRGLSAHVGFARQASAIDEDREDFPRVGWAHSKRIRKAVEGEPTPVVQLWFAGNHSDIGGSYEEAESRLSDVALQWMIEEVETLPHPLILDRARLKVWPDHAGVQHSELVSLRDRRLWWVPRWFPATLRNGWPLGRRTPSGYPLHPSVYARLSEEKVVQPIGTGHYRPENLASDPRLLRYWSSGTRAVSVYPADPGTTLRYGDSEAFLSDQVAMAHLLVGLGASRAAALFPVSDPGDRRSLYMEGLGLRELDRMLTGAGLRAVPVWRSADPGQAMVEGRLLPDVDESVAADLGNRIGQPVSYAIDPDGRVRLRDLDGAPASSGPSHLLDDRADERRLS